MKISFKEIDQFMDENALDLADVARRAGVDKSILTRMRKRGTARSGTVEKINTALGIRIQIPAKRRTRPAA